MVCALNRDGRLRRYDKEHGMSTGPWTKDPLRWHAVHHVCSTKFFCVITQEAHSSIYNLRLPQTNPALELLPNHTIPSELRFVAIDPTETWAFLIYRHAPFRYQWLNLITFATLPPCILDSDILDVQWSSPAYKLDRPCLAILFHNGTLHLHKDVYDHSPLCITTELKIDGTFSSSLFLFFISSLLSVNNNGILAFLEP